VASGIGFMVGLVVASVVLAGSLVAALFNPRWGAIGYTVAIYAAFAVMGISSWSIRVRKNEAWEDLNQLDQYVLNRHRVFFYFPFGATNFGHFCNWTRMFAVLWAIFCVWRGWYWLSAALAFFYVVATPMIVIWIPIPHYQKLVQKGHQWAQDRLNAMQNILDRRDALGFNAAAMVERTLDNPERATAPPPSRGRDNATRTGRRGICMLCGTIKSGSYVPCEECGFQPISDEELAIAVMLNETSVQNFEQISRSIKSGQIPEYNDKDIEKCIGTSTEARRVLGLQQARYYTRAKTESLLTYSVQVAAQGMSETIAKIGTGELKGLLKERMLAVLGEMIKDELIRRAPVSEKEFIKCFFGKRLVLMSMQSRFPSLSGTSKDEFARRIALAIRDFEAKGFNVSGGKQTLERAIISFVLPDMGDVRDYMKRSHGDPYIGSYLFILADSYAKAMDEHAAGWK
jgi:hypothetical protein